MDLQRFFQSLVSRWRLVVMIWITIIVLSIIYVLLLPTLYRSHGTFIIRPISSIGLSEDLVNAIDTLSRRVEINSTYAEIASSRNIKERVIENLDLSSDEIQNLQIAGNTISGTNVLEISVIARNPDLALAIAGEVAKETLSSAREIYDVFELELLDDFEKPNNPIDSNKSLIVFIGIGFGFAAGVAAVFLVELINLQLLGMQSVQFIDRESGRYSRAYFDHRLTQEISRSNRNKYHYSLALIRLINQLSSEESGLSQNSKDKISKMNQMLSESFREEDVIAQYDLDTIGLLIPDLVGEDTRDRLEAVFNGENLSSEDENRSLTHQDFAVGIVSVEHHDKDKDELLRLLSQTVFLASEEDGDGIVLRTDRDNDITK